MILSKRAAAPTPGLGRRREGARGGGHTTGVDARDVGDETHGEPAPAEGSSGWRDQRCAIGRLPLGADRQCDVQRLASQHQLAPQLRLPVSPGSVVILAGALGEVVVVVQLGRPRGCGRVLSGQLVPSSSRRLDGLTCPTQVDGADPERHQLDPVLGERVGEALRHRLLECLSGRTEQIVDADLLATEDNGDDGRRLVADDPADTCGTEPFMHDAQVGRQQPEPNRVRDHGPGPVAQVGLDRRAPAVEEGLVDRLRGTACSIAQLDRRIDLDHPPTDSRHEVHPWSQDCVSGPTPDQEQTQSSGRDADDRRTDDDPDQDAEGRNEQDNQNDPADRVHRLLIGAPGVDR